MGLYVHSLGELPKNVERAYYIYVLDYGWHESLGEALKKNLPKMMESASRNDAVVMKGFESHHFQNEVFSWHGINGENGDELLPAILITTLHPKYFRENNDRNASHSELDDKLLLVPLKKACQSSDEVVELITKIFSDIENKKSLCDFSVQREMRKGQRGYRSLADALILQPNVAGIGIDLKKVGSYFTNRNEDKS